MWNDAPTFDEMVSPAAGYAEIFTGDLRLIDDHPPLARTLMALPLLIFQPRLPLEHLSWREKEKDRKYRYEFARQFFYAANQDPERMLFWSRISIVSLALLLGLLVFRWAAELYGAHAGLLALFLYVFEPNIMAHSRLATNDVPLTLLIFCTVLQFWTYRREPSLKALVLTGAILGFALLTKFSALLLLPMLFLLGLFAAPLVTPKAAQAATVRTLGHRAGQAAVTVFIAFVVAGVVVLGFYHARAWLFLQSMTNAIVHYGADYLAFSGHPAFLLGEVSVTGWWYYFPIAFAVKTPVPLLIFILIALLARTFRNDQAGLFLFIPVGVVLLAALASDLNIGLRHILPAYPFLIVIASSVVTCRFSRPAFFAAIFVALGLWYLISTARIFPNYLAYFNEFVGPENGYRVLVDSNLDWGQDLKRLKRFMSEKGISEVYLSYFGTADPCYYEIKFIPLPGSPPDCQKELERRHPADYIAISATNLQSVYLPVQSYQWLKERSPMAQVGYSIFVYDIRRDAAVHNELGILFLQYKRLREAAAEFESVTALEPRASIAYVNLGVAYSFLADFGQAQQAFEKALELEPDNETAKKGLAVIHRRSEPHFGAARARP